MQNYNPKNPINFHDLIVMADELHKALDNIVDTIVELYGNEVCPTCGEEEAGCASDCALVQASELCKRINISGQLKAVKKLHKVSN